ncbi:MAG: hypothetical protein AAF587_40500 [Bacteroidota bacterium]
MNMLSSTIGWISALVILLSSLLFGGCFMGLFITHPPPAWTTLQAYAEACQTYDQTLKHIAQASMIPLTISILVLIAILHEQVQTDRRFLSRLSLQFGSITTCLISLGYFIQITSVRWNLSAGNIEDLAHFVQFYPNSVILSIIMLGYTLFLGLSSVCIFPILPDLPSYRLLRWGFLINAISCGLGCIGFVGQIIPLILIATNFGNGSAFILLGIGGMKAFGKNNSQKNQMYL